MINSIYELRKVKIINPFSYKGIGRPKKSDYLSDLLDLLKLCQPIKVKCIKRI